MYKLKPRVIDVEIYDQKYSIVPMSPMRESDVETLAQEVDRRMREIAAIASTADSLKIAVLAALHLAQELRELRKSVEQRDAAFCRKTEEWSHALEELLQANPR